MPTENHNPHPHTIVDPANAKGSIHLLVLETDSPHPETEDDKGSFGAIFHELFKTAGEAHDPPLKLRTSMHYVVDDPENGHNGHVPSPDEIGQDVDAVLITGSMYDAHGDEPWVLRLMELLRELWRTRAGRSKDSLKFSGVCFGHQLLSRMLGSKVEGTAGGKWELSHTSMSLTPVGKKLFRTEDETLSVHQMHQDQVTTVPSVESAQGLLKDGDKVHVWASTDHTRIQGLYIRDRLFTSQGHLGFDEDMVHRQIELRKEAGAIDKDDSQEEQEAKEKAHMKHDGEIVAGALLRFFAGEDADVD